MAQLGNRTYDTLFLDRDGIINRLRPGDYVKSWDEFEFLPGALNALTKCNAMFRRILVVTNQRGVGKGLMTRQALDEIHRRMLQTIAAHGGRIDKIYCCTGLSENDPCRKPNIGMALQAQKGVSGDRFCIGAYGGRHFLRPAVRPERRHAHRPDRRRQPAG